MVNKEGAANVQRAYTQVLQGCKQFPPSNSQNCLGLGLKGMDFMIKVSGLSGLGCRLGLVGSYMA